MIEIPEPHPLDYDWRFDDGTVVEICELIPATQAVIAVGAPSVARRLEAQGRRVALVDRQPFQGVQKHFAIEVGGATLDLHEHKVAVLDPPWYVQDIEQWTSWAAGLVGTGGEIIVSLWPDSTRPTAARELAYLFRWFSTWATVQELPLVPRYVRPLFEGVAENWSAHPEAGRSPRFGRLFRLRLRSLPPVSLPSRKTERWLRLVLNEYQLALRLRQPTNEQIRLEHVPGAVGWNWPQVSKRAVNRPLIDLWSSHNEVAIVGNSARLANTLRNTIARTTTSSFLSSLAEYPELLGWNIPRPPYWRKLEWHHRQ